MDWKTDILEQGFSAFYRFLEGFRAQLRTFSDQDIGLVQETLQKAKKTIPDPGCISPSWDQIWEELESIIHYKIKLLNQFPPNERTKDWQIIIHNPYTTQEVVCYPNLNFLEAAYLLGYFKPQLEKNEYIQIQKIETKIEYNGD